MTSQKYRTEVAGKSRCLTNALPIALTLLALSMVNACTMLQTGSAEILLALKPAAIQLLTHPQEPDPLDTGIPSIDALNRKWGVQQMTPVFPDVSPDDELAAKYGLIGVYKLTVPVGTDLATMITEYQSDPHVEYMELNPPVTIK